MVLVFYIVISIILTILNLAFLISISELELDIKNLQMSNINKKRNNEKIQIKVSLKIGNFHWLSIKITKAKLSAIYAKIKEKQYKKNITNKLEDIGLNILITFNKVEEISPEMSGKFSILKRGI